MLYFKSNNGDVFAYNKEDIAKIDKLTEQEKLTKEKEPAFLIINNGNSDCSIERINLVVF